MFSTNNQVEFKKLLKEFSEAKQTEYSYAYSAGYMESLAGDMFASLTKKEQKFFMSVMQKQVDAITV